METVAEGIYQRKKAPGSTTDETPGLKEAAPASHTAAPGHHVRPETPPQHLHDVVVVGTGISGLYTARCLHNEGLDVIVLEGRDRVGGRSHTIRDPECGYADLGAAYFGHSQTKVLGLAEELGLEFQRLNKTGDGVIWYKGSRQLADEDLPTLNPLILMDLNHVLRVLDNMSKQVPPEAPWLAEKADDWDNLTLAEFLQQLAWSERAATFINRGFSIVFGVLPTEISLLFALSYIRTSGGIKNLFSSRDGLQHMKMKGGSGQLSEKMASELKGHIMLDSPVCSVHQYSHYVIVKTGNNKEYMCKRAVMALSPVIMKNIDFLPPVPTPQRGYMEYKAEGNSMKTFMVYDKPHWRTNGLNGELLSDSGIIVYALEDMSDGQSPAIMGFPDPQTLILSKEERKNRIAKHYAEAFGVPEMNNPTYYIEHNWDDPEGMPFSGSCVHTLPPGFLTKNKCLWGTQHQRVHFAGTETSITFRGYMDGAVRAGERAAKEVLDGLGLSPQRSYDVEYEEIPYLPKRTVEKVLPSVGQCLIISSMLIVITIGVVLSWCCQLY